MQKIIIALLLCVFVVHCAASQESTFDDNDANVENSGNTTLTIGTGGGFSIGDTNKNPSIDGNFGGAGTCYSDEVKQETNVVNLVFLLDRSASMVLVQHSHHRDQVEALV